MRNWQLLVLLFGLLTTSYADDDGIVVEDEPAVNPTPDPDAPSESTISYQSPIPPPGKYHFADHFDDPKSFNIKWIRSQTNKFETDEKFDGEWSQEAPERPILANDLGLVLKSKAKHAAIAARLNKPFVFNDKSFIVQYEVQLQEGQDCGGSYIKLLSAGKETADLKNFHDKSPYTIMFGPDKCGNDIKLHFIFRHVNPINGTITEKHCKKPKERLEEPFKDKKPHLYKLVINPDNTFAVSVDHKIVNEGSLFTDFEPPVNPPKEIDDPNDKKPESWDEREKIADPAAVKPDDWDENAPPQIPDPSASKPDGWLDDEEEMVPDPSAIKPDDWDIEIDGEWEAPLVNNPICEKSVGCGLWKAPLISNPNYRGKWRAPLIDNPNYQGKWAPRRISNPDFFEDLHPFRMTSIAAIGIEIWSMSNNILFDNLLITDDENVADEWAAQTYDLKKKQIDKDATSLWTRTMRSINYKPGWWTLYFIYCTIPIAIYCRYLYKAVKDPNDEETFVTRVLKLTEERPWLWAVFILVGGLPLFLFLYFRCFNRDTSADHTGYAKKTDETQPDHEDAEGDNDGDRASENTPTTQRASSPRTTKKSDLDEPIAVDENSSSAVDDDDSVGTDNDNLEVNGTSSRPSSEPPADGARKRKPRKE